MSLLSAQLLQLVAVIQPWLVSLSSSCSRARQQALMRRKVRRVACSLQDTIEAGEAAINGPWARHLQVGEVVFLKIRSQNTSWAGQLREVEVVVYSPIPNWRRRCYRMLSGWSERSDLQM